MAMKIIIYCWLLTGLVEGQKLLVNTKVIQLGLQKQLDVQCFYQADQEKIVQLTNLSILFTKNKVKPDFETLATIGVKDGIEKATDAEISGVTDQHGKSWLNLTWAYPFQEMVGVYKCIANGLNKNAKTVSSHISVTISAVEPKMKDLLRTFKDQVKKIDGLMGEQAVYRTRLQRFKNLLFHQSEPFKGHRYLLSVKRFSTSDKEAEVSCEQNGGYLAEFETEEEFEFIKSFLSNFPSYTSVMMSGCDELVENTWISQYTNKPLKMVKWHPKEPNGGRDENCIGFWRGDFWYVGDIPCETNTDKYVHGYLCEVPETPTPL